VHSDIREGSMARSLKRACMGWSERAMIRNFGRHIFCLFRVEANIIMRRHEVLCRLSSDSKMIDPE